MLRRRVSVLRLGSRVQEVTKRRCVYVRKASAGGRKHSPVSRSVGRKTQNCRHFLDFAIQKCQQSQGSGGPVAKHVVTFGLAFGRRISGVSRVTAIGRVLVTKCRTVVTLNLRLVVASQKCQQSQGSEGSWSRNAESSSPLDLLLVRREERREERRERREKRREERGERGERGGESREKREREKRREGRGGKTDERREERGEERGPDLGFLIGVARWVLLSLRCTCHLSAFGFVDPIRFGFKLTRF